MIQRHLRRNVVTMEVLGTSYVEIRATARARLNTYFGETEYVITDIAAVRSIAGGYTAQVTAFEQGVEGDF